MLKRPVHKALLGIIVLIMSVAVITYMFSDIVMYIVISLILTSLLKIPTNYISQVQIFKIRIPRILAIAFSFVLLFSIITLFVYLFVPLVSKQIQVISTIDFEKLMNNAMTPIKFLEDFILQYNFIDEEKGFLVKKIKEMTNIFADEIFSNFRPTVFINNILNFTGKFFTGGLAILFITFFILYEKGALRKRMISLIPNNLFEVSISLLGKVESMLGNYLFGLLIQMISVFSIVAFGLLIAGIDYAVTIGVFAALINLIPYIGPILGALFGLIVGLSTNIDFVTANEYYILILKIVAVFGVVQLTDNILLQPLIFSRSVKAHPLEIFLIVFVGASLASIMSIAVPLGMIAAIPVYTIIKLSIMEFYKGYKQYAIFRM